MLIFLLTAAVGVWASYDQSGASKKFWIILSSAFVFYSLAGKSRRDASLMSGVLGTLSGLIAAYFLLTNDWKLVPADFESLQRLAIFWMDLRPSLQFSGTYQNSIAGAIVILLPFLIAFGLYCWKKNRSKSLIFAIALGLIAAAGLLLTSSRGAWISLSAGLSLWVLWWLSGCIASLIRVSSVVIYLVSLALILGLGLGTTFFILGDPCSLLLVLPGPDSTTTRLALFDHTTQLCRDFPLTGGGLAAFGGLYSTYIRVIPFFQFSHSHNLFLDVLLEQGIGGFLSLLLVLLGSFLLLLPPISSGKDQRISKGLSVFRWATFASLVTMVLHGLMDDALYGTLGTPLLFLLPGMAVALSAKHSGVSWYAEHKWYWIFPGFSFLIAGAILIVSSVRVVEGIWYSNRGAVQMAKIELAHWPTNEWNDGSNADELNGAAQLFELALSRIEDDFTAHYRLGLIAMLRRDYLVAAKHLEAAHLQNSRHIGVTKSLGYCHVWIGRLERALSLLKRIPEARQEMDAYVHFWRTLGREDLALNAERMASILD
jgi:O-antigen ligase